MAVFLAPYISWRPGAILFTVSDMLFVLGAVLIVLAHHMPLRPFAALTPYWLLALAVMLGGLYLGSIINGDPLRWAVLAGQYLFSLALLPLLLMRHDRGRTYLFFKAFVAGVTCMELFGSALYFAYGGQWEPLQRFGPDFVTGGGRLSAFLADANWNAAMIAMAIPFVYYLRIAGQLGQALFASTLTILLVGLSLTASVTGMVSATLATIIFLIIGKVRPPMRLLAAGGAALALLFASGYALPRAFQNRIVPALESGELSQAGTYTGRVELIGEAWDRASDAILIGIGADQFRNVSPVRQPVHNLYLLLWIEGGLPSLIGWLWMMGILAISAISMRRYDRLGAALALSVFATFVIYCGASPHMYARQWIVPLLLAMAPVFAIMGRANKRIGPETTLHHYPMTPKEF
ncbi:O-antigen ligase family protein [Sphingomonas cavernae]|nr:O-antigen ligase family protein [Sphingomonas cavernae]